MIISIPRERRNGETRVAATPETVRRYVSLGFAVRVEQNAGRLSGFPDETYRQAGAEIVADTAALWKGAGLILKIWAPQPEEDAYLFPGQTIVANFQALDNRERAAVFAARRTTCFALELIPRISRAQSMDILTSQSNLAGYKAVLKGVNMLDRALPMMMTAAGTVPPARVLILGAGVAGLQAIATAKRLGAQVYAADVRPSVKEQVESLGARFVDVENEENFEDNGGYAGETSAAYQKRQQKAVAEQLAKTDLAVTTALIPGKPAPRLISAEMLRNMPEGSVVVDMAAAAGGNVEGSQENRPYRRRYRHRQFQSCRRRSCLGQHVVCQKCFQFSKCHVQPRNPKHNFRLCRRTRCQDLHLQRRTTDRSAQMIDIWMLFTILVLACFVGYFVVWGVTPALHSPLMSVSNAISGVVIVGALITAGTPEMSSHKILGLIAIVLASINIFGGFAVSQRMLEMFKKKNRRPGEKK